jgi:hypothetical protein
LEGGGRGVLESVEDGGGGITVSPFSEIRYLTIYASGVIHHSVKCNGEFRHLFLVQLPRQLHVSDSCSRDLTLDIQMSEVDEVCPDYTKLDTYTFRNLWYSLQRYTETRRPS